MNNNAFVGSAITIEVIGRPVAFSEGENGIDANLIFTSETPVVEFKLKADFFKRLEGKWRSKPVTIYCKVVGQNAERLNAQLSSERSQLVRVVGSVSGWTGDNDWKNESSSFGLWVEGSAQIVYDENKETYFELGKLFK
jgi:hypothetical protein